MKKKTMTVKKVTLKNEHRITSPWIYSNIVKHPNPKIKAGSIVEVYDRKNKFVGRGFYHPKKTIAIQIITEKKFENIDKQFFFDRLKMAKDFREKTLNLLEQTDSYRLIHAEGDRLSGVIIDKFNDVIIVEPKSAGIFFVGDIIAQALKHLYPGSKIAFRVSEKTIKLEGVDFHELVKKYPFPDKTTILENGVQFRVNFKTGHKTGYFLDQKDNHKFLAEMCEGKKVYDLFSYTGGFGLTALKYGAKDVVSVDLDEKALKVAVENGKLNGLPQEGQTYNIIHQDAFDFLREAKENNDLADVITVDPAKLVTTRDGLSVAIRKYGDINKFAIQAVKPGGILATFSCSGLVSEEKFISVVSNSAIDAGRTLQIFKLTGASPDHPVSSRFLQGRYLKGIFARVW